MKNGKYLNLKNNRVLIIFSILVLSLILRLYFVFYTDNFYGAIPAQKIIHSQSVSADVIGSIWEVDPILYPYLLKVWMSVFGKIDISPRILSLLFGMLTFMPFFLTVRIIKDELHAILATFLIGFFPIHIIWSTLSMEEAPFYFIVFSALYLFFKYKFGSPKRIYLVLSAILISCSFGFRFEGILYPVVLTLFLLKDKDKKNIFIFLAVSLSLPILWMLLCWMRYKNPFVSFARHSFYSHLEVADRYSLRFIIDKIKMSFSVSLLPLGIWGYFITIRDKKMRIINAIFFLFLFAFIIKILTKTLLWQERYLLCFGLFFLIYIAIGIVYLSKCLKNYMAKVILILIFCLYNIFFTVDYISHNKNDFLLNSEIKNIINYLSNINDKSKILIDIDEDHGYPELIAVYSNIDLERVKISQEIDVYGNKVLHDIQMKDYKNRLLNFINNKYFDYIIYSPKGRSLRWLFSLKSENERIGKIRYKRTFTGEIYWIYRRET